MFEPIFLALIFWLFFCTKLFYPKNLPKIRTQNILVQKSFWSNFFLIFWSKIWVLKRFGPKMVSPKIFWIPTPHRHPLENVQTPSRQPWVMKSFCPLLRTELFSSATGQSTFYNFVCVVGVCPHFELVDCKQSEGLS